MKIAAVLGMLLAVLVLCGCGRTKIEEAASDASPRQWPASDQGVHTAESLALPSGAVQILKLDENLVIHHLKIDDVFVYEVYCTPEKRKWEPVLILLHEYGNSKDQFLEEAVRYAQNGFFCVLMDMKGFGERMTPEIIESSESVTAATEDIDLLLEYYRLSPVADSDCFSLYGQSMGGSAVYHYAAYGEKTPKSIVTGSSSPDFLCVSGSPGAVQNGKECPSKWTEDEYQRYSAAQNPMDYPEKLIHLPMLIFHGMKDTIVPFESASSFAGEVKKAGNEKAVFIFDEEAGHSVNEEFLARVVPFLNLYGK